MTLSLARVLITCVLPIAASGALPAASAGPAEGDSVGAVLEELNRAESRPRAGTFRWTVERWAAPAPGALPAAQVTEAGVERDAPDGWTVEVGLTETLPSGERATTHRTVACYDGRRTTHASYFGPDAEVPVVHLFDGERPPGTRLNPFLLAITRESSGSLAGWLGGGRAADDDPLALDPRTGGRRTQRLSHRGRRRIDGANAVVLEAAYLSALKPDGPPAARRVFFLDPDRDYLPVRVETWDRRWSDRFPAEVTTLSGLVRAADGRWTPRRAETERLLEGPALRGEQVTDWRAAVTMSVGPVEDSAGGWLRHDALAVAGARVFRRRGEETVGTYLVGERR